jgi:hypothetical protein
VPNRKLRWGKVVKDIKKNKNLLDGFGRRREKNKRAVKFEAQLRTKFLINKPCRNRVFSFDLC